MESIMELINRLNKMKIKGSLKVIDIELQSLAVKGKMDKLHEAIKDSDVSSFKTTIQMV